MEAREHLYVRVIPQLEGRDQASVDAVVDEAPGITRYKPTEPHPRGGFALFLEFPAGQAERLLLHLRAEGLLPCF